MKIGLTDALILALMLIALAVFCFNLHSVAPWPLIACYWAVLTVKNGVDYKRWKK